MLGRVRLWAGLKTDHEPATMSASGMSLKIPPRNCWILSSFDLGLDTAQFIMGLGKALAGSFIPKKDSGIDIEYY